MLKFKYVLTVPSFLPFQWKMVSVLIYIFTLSRFFFEFVMANERNVAEEICAEYVDTMGKIYFSYFKAYSTRVSKLQVCTRG